MLAAGGWTMTTHRWGATAVACAFACGALGAPREASAFCGFYVSGADAKLFNDATMVVMMREGTKTVLSMQNAYQGPPQDFAMVVPVPVVLHAENVKTLSRDIFDHVDSLTAPRLVEYWEQDPCYKPPPPDPNVVYDMAPAPASGAGGAAGPAHVKVEATFSVGEYDVVVLSSDDSGALDTWLHTNGYKIPDGAAPFLRPYVAQGSKFFVAKVNTAKVQFDHAGHAMLSPLRFHYDADTFTLPIRLGLINSNGTQDLIVNLIGKRRYEVANYPNVTIPTNLDVAEGARNQFGGFYTALFDATVAQNPRAVVTEYAWQPTSCDPCPTPPLDMGDLATLGLDVLEGASADASATSGDPTGGYYYSGPSFVVTRLHARYSKDALGDDLVFKEVDAIVGGRENMGADGKIEHGAQPSSDNNFQARYVVRHRWMGAINCSDPIRGRWGGPWDQNAPQSMPMAAAKVQFAPRGAVQLASLLRQDVPEVGVRASFSPEAPDAPPTVTPRRAGCGACLVTARRASPAAGVVAALSLGILVWWRKRRRSRD
jgi:hypothetical protein